jgi:hypothetical protein
MFEETLGFKQIIITWYGRQKNYHLTTKNSEGPNVGLL